MKQILILVLIVSGFGVRAQHCPDVPTWTLPDPVVCDVNYGDANGNSPWNWEILDQADPNYCKMWYARTATNTITAMGSPFVETAITSLRKIALAKDFTKEKGWVLLRRDFGCHRVNNYPYFVLYNTFSGLLRVFVYQGTAADNTGLMVEVKPTQFPYPALTALADPLAASTDKFKNNNSDGNGNGIYGNSVIAVGEVVGLTKWTVTEFYVGFDPNTALIDYKGTGLQFTIYNVQKFEMEAKIKGSSVTSTDPEYVKNFNFALTTPPQPENGAQKFIATGQKIAKTAKTVEDGRKDIYKAADGLYEKFKNAPSKSLQGTLAKAAQGVKSMTDETRKFAKFVSTVSSTLGAIGSVLDVVSGIMGIFSDEGPTVSYTSINLELKGSLTAKSVALPFIITTPGSYKDPNNPSDPSNQNRAYYDCPLGVLALKTTPQADVMAYYRSQAITLVSNNFPPFVSADGKNFKSYKLKNNLAIAVNEKAGLELVSAKIAFVGEVLPSSQDPAKPAYNPLIEHYSGDYNYMLPDFQNGRLQLVDYNENGLHSFRSEFVDIGCANGLTFNVVALTKVYLRLSAVLKRKDDPTAAPVFFTKDYAIETTNVEMPDEMKFNYTMFTDSEFLPPYTNLTQVPDYKDEVVLQGGYFNNGDQYGSDNNIVTTRISPTNAQNVSLSAGGEITLSPGFEAGWGTGFTARIHRHGFNLNCINPLIEKYNPAGNCYNTTAIPQFHASDDKIELAPRVDQGVSIYPVPSNGSVTVEVKGLPMSTATVTDLSGKIVHQQSLPNAITNLNLKHLPNGVYFIKIIYPGKVIVKKIMLNK
jgi:hypothetical protein